MILVSAFGNIRGVLYRGGAKWQRGSRFVSYFIENFRHQGAHTLLLFNYGYVVPRRLFSDPKCVTSNTRSCRVWTWVLRI